MLIYFKKENGIDGTISTVSPDIDIQEADESKLYESKEYQSKANYYENIQRCSIRNLWLALVSKA